jgi:putative hydrolase of the HAD superfamily
LLCDLDGVVRHWPGHGRDRGEQAAGLPAGTIRELGYGMAFELANLGIYSHEQWLAAVAELLNQRHGPGAEAAIPLWDADPGVLDQHVVALLRRVHAGGTPIGLLTNNTTALRRDLTRHGLTDLFAVVINSAEVELVKPAPAIFRLAAQELDLSPADILFVDDKLANVLGARHVGMRAEQFMTPAQLVDRLAAAGIPLAADVAAPAEYIGDRR